MDILCDFNNLQKNGHYKPLLEKEELKTQLLLNIRSCLSYLFPNGTFCGNEYRIGNLQGSKGKSLRVELTGNKAGLWNDFATGEGGDIIDLWAAAHRKDVKAEFHEVMASIGLAITGNIKLMKLSPQPPGIILMKMVRLLLRFIVMMLL